MIGEIDRRLAYNQKSEKLDSIFPFLKVKQFMLQISEVMKFEGIGLDYVVSKRDHSITIIDFNSYPGYKVVKRPQLKHIHERYFNEQYLKLKKDQFQKLLSKDSKVNFTSSQMAVLTKDQFIISLGFIDRSFKVAQFDTKAI